VFYGVVLNVSDGIPHDALPRVQIAYPYSVKGKQEENKKVRRKVVINPQGLALELLMAYPRSS
jgi:hypothetical protein